MAWSGELFLSPDGGETHICFQTFGNSGNPAILLMSDAAESMIS